MALESGTYVNDLNSSNPVGTTDPKAQGDDHLRLIKAVLKNTFPGATKALRIQQARADLASAETVDLGAVTSDYVRITGTTAIAALGTAPSGVRRNLVFQGAAGLINSAALVLPGSANITAAAGDHAVVVSLGSGNWVVEDYTRASGRALVQPSISELAPDLVAQAAAFMTPGISMEWNGALADVPDGWLPCDGRAISRSTYSVLFGKIGILHGSGDGTTTFNIPDDRGSVVAGLDDMGTAAGAADRVEASAADSVAGRVGAETHELEREELPAERIKLFANDNPGDYGSGATDVGANHRANRGMTSGNPASGYALKGSTNEATVGTSEELGDGEAHNNMQPTVFKIKIIWTGVLS